MMPMRVFYLQMITEKRSCLLFIWFFGAIRIESV